MFGLLSIFFTAVFATYTNIMLPLTTVSNDGVLDTSIEAYLSRVKNAGVHGLMVDVWWGIVEKFPRVYNFDPYIKLADMLNNYGLKLQCVLSFHRCGGNVGDNCNIPLPSWVLNTSDIYFRDMDGGVDYEYISWDVDNEPVLSGRTPLECYQDFMQAFADAMGSRMGSIVEEVQVGLGPCGELRYPGYQMDRWSFPGVGEFQAYSDKMKASFLNYTTSIGHPEWNSPPTDCGGYNSRPSQSSFFSGGYKSDYGKAFLTWYQQILLDHGEAILKIATSIFNNYNTAVAMKVSGIHWWYDDASHAAELTTGYINGDFLTPDAYNTIAQLCKKYGVVLDFTCFEMTNDEQDSSAGCNPQGLVYQVISAVKNYGVTLSAENALERYDTKAFNRVLDNSCNKGYHVHAFTYLRWGDQLFNNGGFWSNFCNLVNSLNGC